MDPLRDSLLTLLGSLDKHLPDKRFATDTKETRCYLLVRHFTTTFATPGHKSWCNGEILACMSVVTTGTPLVYHLLPMCPTKFEVSVQFSASKCRLLHFCHIFVHCVQNFRNAENRNLWTVQKILSCRFLTTVYLLCFQWDLPSHSFKTLIAMCCV